MIIVAALVIIAVLAVRPLRRNGGLDAPGRLVAFATSQLPADRSEWAQAMVAELAHIDGPAHRWRYAIGTARIAVLPPGRHPRRAAVVAVVGLLTAIAATIYASFAAPTLTVFAATLGAMLSAYAVAQAARGPRTAPVTAPYVLVVATALAGVAATIAAVVRVATAHPAATTDKTHVVSVMFALTLTGYIAIALIRPHPVRITSAAMWWTLATTLGCFIAWLTAALAVPGNLVGTIGYLWLIGAAATATATIGTALSSRSGPAGIRAGILTAILTAPVHFTADIATLLNQRPFTLATPYDVAAYPRSGYPDVASYILGDAVAGELITGLVLYPIVLSALAMVCANLCRNAARPAAH